MLYCLGSHPSRASFSPALPFPLARPARSLLGRASCTLHLAMPNYIRFDVWNLLYYLVRSTISCPFPEVQPSTFHCNLISSRPSARTGQDTRPNATTAPERQRSEGPEPRQDTDQANQRLGARMSVVVTAISLESDDVAGLGEEEGNRRPQPVSSSLGRERVAGESGTGRARRPPDERAEGTLGISGKARCMQRVSF
jgi:hypothetical protein